MAKKTSKKVRRIINENALLAFAITSVLFNMFFIIGLVTYQSTNRFNDAILNNAIQKYCDDYLAAGYEYAPNAIDAENLSQSEMLEINCRSAEFAPYYNQAVENFMKDMNR